MNKPLLSLKPSFFNALIPMFVKNLIYSGIITVVLYGLSFVLEFLNILNPISNKIFLAIVILVALAVLPLIISVIILANSNYYFYKTHVESEFEFFIIKKHSTPYNQITNISTDISIWDRICRAGDITLYTAEDNVKNLTLKYIENPQKIEQEIYSIMKSNSNQKTK
ncbi:PH domain-containing protein [archaeon]|jgi:hypothetical protein|nr:PH domain-containing protein [archaeon]MBT4022619.1 PH domain-containing protein [archaeon]MBT4272059.1 PH domain-containing protein [archaeon]MBT4461156.1 PH domain-containing protein [archaeon]MBT4858851.1 PH domain-containing protein [archaeon]